MTLRGLIDAVERGEWDSRTAQPSRESGLDGWSLAIDEIMDHGSLDAAKRLHDALLPGWWATMRYSTRPLVTVGYLESEYRAQDDDLARAWLLAILRALADQREGGRRACRPRPYHNSEGAGPAVRRQTQY